MTNVKEAAKLCDQGKALPSMRASGRIETVPSIFAILVLSALEICEARLSSASLNCCDDQVNRFDSISLVQQLPFEAGQMERGTPGNNYTRTFKESCLDINF